MSQDFEDLLASLNDANVKYLIGGAHALALHARPRATKDLDIFVEPTKANARRFLVALRAFFGGTAPSYVTEAELLDPNVIIQLGVAPIRVDILSAFATISFSKAWRQRVDAPFGRVKAHYVGREHLIQEKLHFDRPQDRADVAALRNVPRLGTRSVAQGRPRAKPGRRRSKSKRSRRVTQV